MPDRLPQKGDERRHPEHGDATAYHVCTDGRVLYRHAGGVGEASLRGWSALPPVVKPGERMGVGRG